MKRTGLAAIENWQSSFALLLLGPSKVVCENLGCVIQFGGGYLWTSQFYKHFFVSIYTKQVYMFFIEACA